VPALHHLHHTALDQVGGGQVLDALAAQLDRALGDFAALPLEQVGDGAQRGRLAGAIATQDGHDAAFGHLQGDAFEHEDHVVVDHLDAVDVENDVGFVHGTSLWRGGVPGPCPARNHCVKPSRPHHDWQSAGVRGVSFFSAAYLAAAALTMGLMICSSPCIQSLVIFQALPSQVCMRAQ